MKKILVFVALFYGYFSVAQNTPVNQRIKNINVEKDTIYIDSVSLNPVSFKVLDKNKKIIKNTEYKIDFSKALLIISHKKYPQITVYYKRLPYFLTRIYSNLDEKIIVPNSTNIPNLYAFNPQKINLRSQPFDGLNTSGSISRGFTVGNNQNTVLNSNFNLQISGNLSKDVKLRASISDNNTPLQKGGYTKRFNEFDNVFIELLSKKWNIKAGDIDLNNNENQFLKFHKKVAGVQINTQLNNKKNLLISASGAVVKGKYALNKFNGVEGNQGPYRLMGSNGEPFILIISGSETVFVNGLPIKRGEQYDYTINYNTAEITFTTTFPIRSEMRISVEFQYSDRNYTRFVTYNKIRYKTDKLTINADFYNENDAKNQPLQQNLSDGQKRILEQAGNDVSKMVVPSAVAVKYDENKILYKHVVLNGMQLFEYSNNKNDSLFDVKFTFVGVNKGNYILDKSLAQGRVYKYVLPLNGVQQGQYSPVVRLVAPNKQRIIAFKTTYKATDKTVVNTEIAISNNDKNLFSSIGDENNNGYASKFGIQQLILDNNWKLKGNFNFEQISENFKTIERIQHIEFSRNWNLINDIGKEKLLATTFKLYNNKNTSISYKFQQLKFNDDFKGTKNSLLAMYNFNKLSFAINSSYLTSSSKKENTKFLRLNSTIEKSFNKSWTGINFNYESNILKDNLQQKLSPLSNRFNEIETYFGVGDSTQIFSKVGFILRNTDSLVVNKIQQVSKSKTIYFNSKLIKNNKANLSIYFNYRNLINEGKENEKSINSRIIYNQRFFNNILNIGTVYETNSGNLPQQDFTYLKVDDGKGFYTWNDYNNNGIQELNEFEIAQFQDKANYVRLFLPTINFVKTHQNKISQSVAINFKKLKDNNKFKKILSHFSNQIVVLLNSRQKRVGNSFNLNPFRIENDKLLDLNFNLKNSLYFNRGLQHFSIIYNYINSRNKNSLSYGNQENDSKINQLLFSHKFSDFWLVDFDSKYTINKSVSSNFLNRNFVINSMKISPKLSYLYSKDSHLDIGYTYKKSYDNLINVADLNSHLIKASYNYSNIKKFSLSTSINMILNNFKGNNNSPVAFQMLEGLQPGTNFTWSFLIQKKLTTYLDLNINYLGRKSENSKTIHTGTIQLRALF